MGKEVAEGWEISIQVVVGREVFKQQAGSKGRRFGVGEESGPPGHQRRTGGCQTVAELGNSQTPAIGNTSLEN